MKFKGSERKWTWPYLRCYHENNSEILKKAATTSVRFVGVLTEIWKMNFLNTVTGVSATASLLVR